MIRSTTRSKIEEGFQKEWRARLQRMEEKLVQREAELSKRETEGFQKEVAAMRISVAEENAALYKGRMQAAEGYYKDMVAKMMLVNGTCSTCFGAVARQEKICNCKVVSHV